MREKHEENMGGKRERTRGQGTAIAFGLAMLLGITGCAGKEPELSQKDVSAADASEKKAAADDVEEELQKDEDDADDPEKKAAADDGTEEPKNEGQSIRAAEGTVHLGGKIQSLQADGMMFAHTSLVDENGSVTLLEMEDAEKISVKFTEDTKVEHWTIQGGGAGIDMQDAAVSDLKEGMGVELEGYYDGDTFVATRVIMEDYV